jgi:hypothetical protein
VLEARGWTIHRLWSTDWFKDRHGQIERLLELIEQDRRQAQEERAAEKEARERLASLKEDEITKGENSTETEDSPATLPSMPLAQPYKLAELAPIYRGQDLSTAPASFIAQAIADVAAVEAPLHFADLASRVAMQWDCILSSRRTGRIRAVVEMCAREKQIHLRGDFVYLSVNPNEVPVRSRAGTRIPPERIPPEEYREAILMVLRAGDGLNRSALTKAVRALLGFNRTGPALEDAIRTAIDVLLSEEIIGEGSVGIRLRA